MKVRIKHNQNVIYQNILVADSMYSRLIGLMFRETPEGDGLLLDPCTSIHTFFMRYSLDVVFLNKENKVIKIIRNLKPWKMTGIYLKARKVLEAPTGKLSADLRVGDTLEVEHV